MNRQMKRSLAALAVAAAVGFSGTANAVLSPRLSGLAVYDSELDITWLANANLAATMAFGLPVSGNESPTDDTIEIGSTGRMEWDTAKAWIAAMNNADGGTGYLGFNDWRLASMSVVGGVPAVSAYPVVDCSTSSEPDCQTNELGYMYYYNLTPSTDPPPTNVNTDLIPSCVHRYT
jgi:hypothetical protein